MSSSKGKQPVNGVSYAPPAVPASGSANPSTSLPALLAYITPALDHIMKSPTNNPSKAPAIDVGWYAGIHSALYNYITSQTEAFNPRKGDDSTVTSGTDLYDRLDNYFAETARELLLGAPQDDSALIHYVVPCFNRYSSGAQSVNRLCSYVNRHYVKRAEEDKGWLTMNDVLEHVAKTITANDTRDKLSQKMREKRLDELKKWGYEEGGSAELMAQAQASAEAGSSLDRIVPILSLAHRRFRLEFLEPLLAVPKIHGKKSKKKIPKPGNTAAFPGPRGRLARAVKHLVESSDGDEEGKMKLAEGLAEAFLQTGVRTDHPLRKVLAKYLSRPVPAAAQ